jgi:hypothetical protein
MQKRCRQGWSFPQQPSSRCKQIRSHQSGVPMLSTWDAARLRAAARAQGPNGIIQ